MKRTFVLLTVLFIVSVLTAQDYITLMSGTFYDSNPTLSFKMDSFVKNVQETRWKKVSYNGKTSFNGIDFQIVRYDNIETKKEFDNNGQIKREITTIVKSKTERIVLEKDIDEYEIYFDSTYKKYFNNGLLEECVTYGYLTDSITDRRLKSYMRTKHEYDSETDQIIKISDYASFGLIRYYLFVYNTKDQLQCIEVRDSMNNLGRFCLFNHIKRSKNRLYTANWHRSDSAFYSQSIYEEDPTNQFTIVSRKEFGIIYDEGFSPPRKPYQRTVIYKTELVNRGKIGKIQYVQIFKDHELEGIRRYTYDKAGRCIKEEYGTNEKNFNSTTTYRYKVKSIS